MSRFACWDKTDYKRGPGLLGIETAKMLKGFDIPVECLILWDPVDRSYVGGVGGWSVLPGSDTPIVDTVSHCINVLRHPAAASRESFGNCGNNFQSANTKIYPQIIPCTHGGIGGTPWPATFVPPGSAFIDEGCVPNNPFGIDIGHEPEVDGMTRVTPSQDRAMLDVGDSTAPTRTENLVPGRTEVKVLANHTVKAGESLSLIALKYYGSFNRWGEIYQANLSKIGGNPNVIHPGVDLIIPV